MRKLSEENRARIVELRGDGVSWSKVAKEVGCAISTAKKIFGEETVKVKVEVKEESIPEPLVIVEQARVLKMVPNPRLMLIHFEGKHGFARCIKKVGNNHPPKSLVLVKKVEGENDLYRIA